MLTGMEVQRESGQSKDENSEVVRLKKKINALIDLLEKTQKEKQYLNTFVDGYIPVSYTHLHVSRYWPGL